MPQLINLLIFFMHKEITMRTFFYLLLLLLAACNIGEAPKADTILYNGNVYTVDSLQSRVQAVAIREGQIVALGSDSDIQRWRGEATEMIDLEGQFAMPGFIEGHGHFSGLGSSLMNLNFLNSKNWDEIVAMVAEKAKTAKPGEWITGRGWHQEKWDKMPSPEVLGYPYHDDLSAVSPNNPVVLRHASGHSLFANAKAMEMAGLSADTPNPSGGEIVRDSRGRAVGVFEERAMGVILEAYQEHLDTLSPEALKARWLEGIALASRECLAKGITSFQDAGSSFEEVAWYRELAEQSQLDLRLWAMLRHSYDKMANNMEGLPIIDAGNRFFTVRAIKTEVDGALGAYGAWLLDPYDDKPGFVGQNTTSIAEVERIAGLAVQRDMQLCVHAIGDRANREVLDIFERQFKLYPDKKGLRWRIEHAQHLHPDDIGRFRDMGIIASMQGIHCTSDAPFVVRRLGEQRARQGAYPWRSLLDAGVTIANGTDAPVEDVDPLASFYASVTRKRADTGMAFFPQQRMTRAEAVYSYTLGNAFAAFEEAYKGSLEVGKVADIVVLSQDLLNCTDAALLETKVLRTMVAGKFVSL